MTRLHVSPALSLPLDWMTLSTVVYGARGSGKTTLGSVIAEEVTKAKQRFCAIDLKGDWYGLKSTADGKGDGIPVVVFGGDHQDVPLEDGAGAFIGETIANLEQPAILDLEYFSKGRQVRFLAAFFETLYDRNRDPLLLLMDEAQRYAPQKPIDPDAAKCLGAVEDLVKLGRKHGIGPVLFTQRGSGLNKEVSELCDMMVAFRTPGPLDQDRVKGWLEANTTKAQSVEVMGTLSGLATGTAIFASGHPDLKVFGTYAVRRRETFDSSATPKVGHRKQEPKTLAKPDLEKLKARMADAIERQKADDPKALRAEIGTLRTQLRQATVMAEQFQKRAETPKVETKTERVEIAVLNNGALKRLTAISRQWLRASETMLRAEQAATERATAIRGTAGDLAVAIKPVALELQRITSAPSGAPLEGNLVAATASTRGGVGTEGRAVSGGPVRAGAPVSPGRQVLRRPDASPRAVPPSGSTEQPVDRSARTTTDGINAAQQRLISASAFLESLGIQPTRQQLGVFARVSATSGYFDNMVGPLRSRGLMHPAPSFLLTHEGRAIAGPPTVTTTAELHEYVFSLFNAPQRRMLAALLAAYPESLTRTELGEIAQVSATSGYFDNNLGPLRTAGFVTPAGRGGIAAMPVFFVLEAAR